MSEFNPTAGFLSGHCDLPLALFSEYLLSNFSVINVVAGR
jgi:hypothetical protein